ncbi:MAG: GAF domain-containing protein, partial [Coriobacteriales bacterium]
MHVRRSMSLTGRFIVLAVAVVVTTTLLLGVSSVAGVYQMASAEQSARQRAYADVVVRETSARLHAAYRALLTLAQRDALGGSDPVAERRALSNAVVENAEYIQRVVLADESGSILSAYPVSDSVSSVTMSHVIESARSGETMYVWEDVARGSSTGVVWVVVPLPGTEGRSDRYLVGQVRVQTISNTLSQIASADRSPVAFIVDDDLDLRFSAGDPEALAAIGSVAFTPEAQGTGVARIPGRGRARYQGVYSDVEGLKGLAWRVVVLEPATVVAEETWQALRPAVYAWGVSVLFSFAIAVGGILWLARPLRVLERRARAAAAGAVLDPIAVDRKDEVGRLLDSFNLLTMRLNRMHDVSQILARSSDSAEVLDGIASSMAHMLGAVDVDVWLLDETASTATLVRAAGSLESQVGSDVPVDASEWLRTTLRSGGAEVFQGDATSDALMRLHHTTGGEECGLAVPLAKGVDVLGVVAIVCDKPREFTSAEIELARSFAAQASVALDNARLFDQERRARREAEALRHVAESLATFMDLRDALDAAAQTEAELLGMDRSFVALADPESYGARVTLDGGVEARLLREWERLFPEPVVDGLKLPSRWLSADEASVGFGACLEELGMRCALVTCLFRKETFAGLALVGSLAPCPAPTHRAVTLAETIGKQMGLALQNAYLFQQAKARADTLETVFRISQAVSSSLQSKVVLSRVLDVVQKIFSADAVMLMTYDQRRRIITVPMARGTLAREMLEMEFLAGEDIPGRVFETKQAERIEDLEQEDTSLSRVALSQGLRAALVAPLLARGRSIGVLATLSRSVGAFSADDLELLLTFASQGALAIDTADLFSREHHVATVLQESILPTRLPSIPGLDASSVYVPAGSEVEIGGDYYDVFLAPDGRVAVAMGDVCGSGVEAATKTSMIKYAIRG